MSLLRNVLIVAGIALGFPVALVGIGVAHCYASGGSLSVTVLLDCLCFIAGAATVFMGGATVLLLFDRFFPQRPIRVPDDAPLSQAPLPGPKTVPPKPVPEMTPPKPYRIRLARFLGVAPSDLGNTSQTKSGMRFWTSLTTFVRHGPKPRVLIRFFLERIRHAVHGEKSVRKPH
jgi:hypothetical protein